MLPVAGRRRGQAHVEQESGEQESLLPWQDDTPSRPVASTVATAPPAPAYAPAPRDTSGDLDWLMGDGGGSAGATQAPRGMPSNAAAPPLQGRRQRVEEPATNAPPSFLFDDGAVAAAKDDSGDLPWMTTAPAARSVPAAAASSNAASPPLQGRRQRAEEPATSAPPSFLFDDGAASTSNTAAAAADLPWMTTTPAASQPPKQQEAAAAVPSFLMESAPVSAPPKRVEESAEDRAFKEALVAELVAVLESVQTAEESLATLDANEHPLFLELEELAKAASEKQGRLDDDAKRRKEIDSKREELRRSVAADAEMENGDSEAAMRRASEIRREVHERLSDQVRQTETALDEKKRGLQDLSDRHKSLLADMWATSPQDAATGELQKEVTAVLHRMREDMTSTVKPALVSNLRSHMHDTHAIRADILHHMHAERVETLETFKQQRGDLSEAFCRTCKETRKKEMDVVVGGVIAKQRAAAEAYKVKSASEAAAWEARMRDAFQRRQVDARAAVARLKGQFADELAALRTTLLEKEQQLKAKTQRELILNNKSFAGEKEAIRRQLSEQSATPTYASATPLSPVTESTAVALTALQMRVREVGTRVALRHAQEKLSNSAVPAFEEDYTSSACQRMLKASTAELNETRQAAEKNWLRLHSALQTFTDNTTVLEERLREGRSATTLSRQAASVAQANWDEEVRRRLASMLTSTEADVLRGDGGGGLPVVQQITDRVNKLAEDHRTNTTARRKSAAAVESAVGKLAKTHNRCAAATANVLVAFGRLSETGVETERLRCLVALEQLEVDRYNREAAPVQHHPHQQQQPRYHHADPNAVRGIDRNHGRRSGGKAVRDLSPRDDLRVRSGTNASMHTQRYAADIDGDDGFNVTQRGDTSRQNIVVVKGKPGSRSSGSTTGSAADRDAVFHSLTTPSSISIL